MTDLEQLVWLAAAGAAVTALFFTGLCALDKMIDWMRGWR